MDPMPPHSRQQELVGGGRFSWEVAGTRGRPQVPVGLVVLIGGGRCLLGKTAQCSSVSSMKVRLYFELTARSSILPRDVSITNNLGEFLQANRQDCSIPGNAAANNGHLGGDPHLA